MSHTRVKTTYETMGDWGKTDVVTLYCHHNHSSDITTFYHKDGTIPNLCFMEWSLGRQMWDAVELLMSPFEGEWGRELKEGVEYFNRKEIE